MRKDEKEFLRLLRKCRIDIDEIVDILKDYYYNTLKYWEEKKNFDAVIIYQNILKQFEEHFPTK
jgi:hypothetical protein